MREILKIKLTRGLSKKQRNLGRPSNWLFRLICIVHPHNKFKALKSRKIPPIKVILCLRGSLLLPLLIYPFLLPVSLVVVYYLIHFNPNAAD